MSATEVLQPNNPNARRLDLSRFPALLADYTAFKQAEEEALRDAEITTEPPAGLQVYDHAAKAEGLLNRGLCMAVALQQLRPARKVGLVDNAERNVPDFLKNTRTIYVDAPHLDPQGQGKYFYSRGEPSATDIILDGVCTANLRVGDTAPAWKYDVGNLRRALPDVDSKIVRRLHERARLTGSLALLATPDNVPVPDGLDASYNLLRHADIQPFTPGEMLELAHAYIEELDNPGYRASLTQYATGYIPYPRPYRRAI